jgi:hypothetical protein
VPSRVRIADNFQRNLDSGAGAGFDSLITHLFDDVIPNLERFPRMGRDFLMR